jgi:hypothetical protein
MSGRGVGTPIDDWERCRGRHVPHRYRQIRRPDEVVVAPFADDVPFQIVEKCSARGRPEKARSARKRIATLGKGAIVKANGSESGRGKRRRVSSVAFVVALDECGLLKTKDTFYIVSLKLCSE